MSSAAIIGVIAGTIVVIGVMGFDRLRIDDPVGALSVHLLNGIWGTLALGLFYDDQIATNIAGLATGLSPISQTIEQFIGIVGVAIWAFGLSFIFFYIIRLTIDLRVSADEEREGLDIGEHGISAYPDFATNASGGGHGRR
jgi:Amt family ammonium transporter